jgi:CubicO group peptidase (beta-lactamase class C family)
MNARLQWRVLYRDFLFRIVDREMLSSHAKGDASQLLLQILTLLLGVGVLVSLPALFDPGTHQRTLFAWSVEHFLIATTMLTVGIFAVLGWGSMFPDQRDILVLAPLPVRAHTILLAKLAAIGTALAATVVALHVVASVAWTLRLNVSAPSVPRPAYTFEPAMAPLGAADLQAVLDRDFAGAMREGPLAPGGGASVAIGVSTHGVRRVFAYGAATPDSVFHIASVTKPFTGLALATMIEQGAVRAGDPVRHLIPAAGLTRPADGRSDITLVDLVTHRSGLPGMPATFRSRDPENPFAGFDLETLYAFLRARGAGRPADPSFRYSNVGFGLLGHALATRAGVDYDSLIRQLITAPLAMSDTAVALTPDQQRRLVPGHDRDYRAVRVTDVPGILAAAGALKSTAGDLLTWLEANLHPERLPPGPLARAIRASHERQAGAFGDVGIAFAWALTPAGDVWHSGGLVGASSLVSFNPSQERAVVVLANTNPGTTVSADLIADHISARLDGRPPVAIADVMIPAQGGARRGLRLFLAYWVTMLAAGLFVFATAVGLHGLAAVLLPHRQFLRASSVLQFGVFCAVVGTYFMQPMAATGSTMLNAQSTTFAASPSYWFLGLFQALNGSPALAPLAGRALAGLSIAVIAAVGVGGLAYLRTLRRLAEEPDVAPAVRAARGLPRVGRLPQTAIVHFSARTLLRSPAHRILYTFYLGIGFAVSVVLLKAPRTRELTEDLSIATFAGANEPLIISSIVMMVCAVVGARLTFAMPRDLAANWIFRSLPLRGGAAFASARRRTIVVLAAAPVWALSAAVFLSAWPWTLAAGHLTILALLGSILVELCLSGAQGIPFTCSYLPGQSRSHVSAPAAVIVLLLVTLVLADAERRALEDPRRFAAIIATLALGWIGARWRTSWVADGIAPEFEDEPVDRMLSLEVWDTRSPSGSGERASA